MSDATTVSAQLPAALNAAGGVVAHSHVDAPVHNKAANTKAEIKADKPKKVEDTSNTNLSYSVDRDAGALRLKVSNSKGETVRELTFTDFVSTMKSETIAPKGVLVDDRS